MVFKRGEIHRLPLKNQIGNFTFEPIEKSLKSQDNEIIFEPIKEKE